MRDPRARLYEYMRERMHDRASTLTIIYIKYICIRIHIILIVFSSALDLTDANETEVAALSNVSLMVHR